MTRDLRRRNAENLRRSRLGMFALSVLAVVLIGLNALPHHRNDQHFALLTILLASCILTIVGMSLPPINRGIKQNKSNIANPFLGFETLPISGALKASMFVDPFKWQTKAFYKTYAADMKRMLEEEGYAVITRETPAEKFWPLLHQLEEEPFPAREGWTVGRLLDEEGRRDLFIYAFRNSADAVEFALRYF